MKPKTNHAGDPAKSGPMDRCQTPPYAIEPLIPYLNTRWVIWESAAGEGLMAEALRDYGFDVLDTDLLTGTDFFKDHPGGWHAQVTNPPYSVKFKWLERSYELHKPFALLVPVEMLGAGSAQVLMARHGVEIILLDKRVDFKMPEAGWDSSAQFPVMWLTHGLNIGKQITFARLNKPNAQRRAEMVAGVEQLSLLSEVAP